MAIVAVSVFVIAYALIATERIHKVKVALGGAAVVLALGIVGSDDVFYSHETGIDWDVIFLLLGTMVMVGVLRQTGGFEYAAIWAAKRAGGSPLRVMILLVLITTIARRGYHPHSRFPSLLFFTSLVQKEFPTHGSKKE